MKKELFKSPLLEIIKIENADIVLWQSFGNKNDDEDEYQIGTLFD